MLLVLLMLLFIICEWLHWGVAVLQVLAVLLVFWVPVVGLVVFLFLTSQCWCATGATGAIGVGVGNLFILILWMGKQV